MAEEKVSVVGAPNVNTDAELDIEESISQELEQRESTPSEGVPQSETPSPAIDITKLTPDQLQILKAQLASTPDRVNSKKKNAIVKLRRIDGKLIKDFKNAFMGLVDDPENQRKVERHIIPVLLEGEENYKNMMYKQFMQSEQVECEVLEMKQKPIPIVEGETYDPYGQLVEMVRTDMQYEFVVKTPDGQQLNVTSKIVNA